MVPRILSDARIDEVVITDELASIDACYELLREYGCFAGGSSGTVLAGIRQYFTTYPTSQPVNVVTVFPDRGERYYDTIYNQNWFEKLKEYKTKNKTANAGAV